MDAQRTPSEGIAQLHRKQPAFRGLDAGHLACPGCGQALGARLVTEAIGPDVIIANATGCLEVFTSAWPRSSWRVPWIHSLFENAPAVASGIEAALKIQGRPTKVVALGGDGGTFDIGLQSLSGMLERNHNVLYVCFDNEAYMNTGVHRSSSTPHAAMTMTSPRGKKRMGKRHLKKDLLAIIGAHQIPYAATATVAYPSDLRAKVRRGIEIEGAAFLLVHSPCPLGWGHDGALSIEVARLAVQTGIFPIIEMERGNVVTAMKIRDVRPVADYLRPQERFHHLFDNSPEAREELEHLQQLADRNIERYELAGTRPEPHDSEGVDTVSRGGMRWS
ncbi:MAG TPA: thiamine pyrophosphate-dependent enzyme [Candidatus Binataceae bacterium]|nr:thiamine pyrophosphate-dependent enzyme [Candidatus Binataceae bacterium]